MPLCVTLKMRQRGLGYVGKQMCFRQTEKEFLKTFHHLKSELFLKREKQLQAGGQTWGMPEGWESESKPFETKRWKKVWKVTLRSLWTSFQSMCCSTGKLLCYCLFVSKVSCMTQTCTFVIRVFMSLTEINIHVKVQETSDINTLFLCSYSAKTGPLEKGQKFICHWQMFCK